MNPGATAITNRLHPIGGPVLAIFGSLDKLRSSREINTTSGLRSVWLDSTEVTNIANRVPSSDSLTLLGFVALWDDEIDLVSDANRALGISTCVRSLHKTDLYRIARSAGISVPEWRSVRTIEELHAAIHEGLLSYPALVVKPTRGTASRDVFTIDRDTYNLENLDLLVSQSGDHIVSQHIGPVAKITAGHDIAVDAVFEQGVCTRCFVFEKVRKTFWPHFRDRVMVAPPIAVSPHECGEIHERCNLLGVALGIDFAVLHTEWRKSEQEWFLLDGSLRPGGGLMSSAILHLHGADTRAFHICAQLAKHSFCNRFVGSQRATSGVCVSSCDATPINGFRDTGPLLASLLRNHVIDYELYGRLTSDSSRGSDAVISAAIASDTADKAYNITLSMAKELNLSL